MSDPYIQPYRNVHVQGIPASGILNYLLSSVYALTMPLILPLRFVNLSCKITKNPTRLPVVFKTHDSDTDWRDLHAFISKVDLLYIGARKMEKYWNNGWK